MDQTYLHYSPIWSCVLLVSSNDTGSPWGIIVPSSEKKLSIATLAHWTEPKTAAAAAAHFFSFYIFQNRFFFRNIFSVSQFTGLYPYRPVGGRQGPAAHLRGGRPPAPLPGDRGLYVIKISVLSHGGPCRPAGGAAGSPPQYKSRGPPHLHLQQTTSIEEKWETWGWGRELQQRSPAGFWMRTAGNQYFSTLSF